MISKTTPNARPLVSIVVATRNRRDVLLGTLARLARCGLDRSGYEVIVVDNASTDGTPEAVAGEVDLLLPLRRNAGSCAKAYGVDGAGGRYVLFLDDDSSPRPGSLPRMIELFESEARLGAAGFSVHLAGGGMEGGALPGVFVGCGVGFRAEALREVGGLDRSFFMQAEEYDLCFRLVNAGWRVEVFGELHVDHLKVEAARKSDRTTFYDTRNNLRVVARYLSAPYDAVYGEDWRQRYEWLAERHGHRRAFARGVRAASIRRMVERWSYRRWRLSADTFERFFRWEAIDQRMARLREAGVERIVLADLGKNIYAFHRAAQRSRTTVEAIGDDGFAATHRRYRGIPVLLLHDALQRSCDAVVVSNTGPVHATATRERIAALTDRPVHCWFAKQVEDEAAEFHSPDTVASSDDIGAQDACAVKA